MANQVVVSNGPRRAVLFLVGLWICVALSFLSFSAYGTSSVTLAWSPSISTNVAGYKVYYGAASGVYTNVTPAVSSTNVTITGLVEGATYYFSATAVDAQGNESPFSNETSYSIPVPPVVPPLQPPTLNPLNNLAVNENTPLQTVALGGITSGATNQTLPLTVTAVSGNPGLISNPLVNYSSPNSSGALTFTPATNQSGTATITVTVNNNQQSNNIVVRSFVVTVNPVNLAPTLDPLPNIGVIIGSSQQFVSLTGISSGLTNKSIAVSVTAASNNSRLLTQLGVRYSYPNSNGVLTYTPSSTLTGTASVTVTVNNGQALNSVIARTFSINILPKGSKPPVIVSPPTNTVAVAGQTVKFSVVASGNPPPVYQWQCNSCLLPCATNATLQLTNVNPSQAGQYSVTISNGMGATNTAAALLVYSTPAAALQPTTPPARGQFALSVNGVTGYKYVVQTSSDLMNWVSVRTNIAPFTFVDTNASRYAWRFYRAYYQP